MSLGRMVDQHDRLSAARDRVRYACSRTANEMTVAVPNFPGWTVYNAAVHIGRVGVAWHCTIRGSPDDPESRIRSCEEAKSRGGGHPTGVLASWLFEAIDALDDGDRQCYFFMTGGSGTVGL